jgi:hypothetical protein
MQMGTELITVVPGLCQAHRHPVKAQAPNETITTQLFLGVTQNDSMASQSRITNTKISDGLRGSSILCLPGDITSIRNFQPRISEIHE